MKKYSVIIPTLWQSLRLYKLLFDLIGSDFVDEIILIDNAAKFSKNLPPLDKVKLVQPKQNLYIATSWNFGVELARNEHIAICNDDVNFNPNIFGITTEIEGIMGQASDNYHKEYEENPYVTPLVGTRPWGWASFLITKKKQWWPIPDQLRIWYNDDFIVQINPNPKFVLHNFTVQTEMSTTIGEGKFEDVKLQDRIEWEKIKNKQYETKL